MIALWFGVAYLTLLLGKAALALRAAGRSPQPQSDNFSGVVIAQPILSGDPRLSHTLETNLLAVPAAHFLWLIDSDDPVAGNVCAALRSRHATIRIDTIVAPPPPDGCNPKLFKLERARALVGDRVLLVLDDDTHIPAASLSALLAGLEGSDIATGLPGYLDDGRWPSRLLAQFVNNNAILTYLPLLNFAPPPTINGMAYAMRAPRLRQLGGFEPLLAHLTDDLAVARLVLGAGGRIAQTALPQWVGTTVANGGQYMRLMHRWFVFARLLLRYQSVGLQLVIGVLHGLPSLLLWGAVVAALVTHSAVGFTMLGAMLLARAAILSLLQRRIYGRSLHHPLFSLLSELVQPIHLAHAALSQTIVWRTRRYDVRDDQSFHSVA